MVLTPGQQAALFTIALILVAIGGVSTATLTSSGLPPISGVVVLFAGIVGAALIKGYGLSQQAQLKAKLAGQPTGTPSTSRA